MSDERDYEVWKAAVEKASRDAIESISKPAKADPSIRGGHDRADDAPGKFGRFLQAVRSAANGDTVAINREMNKRAASGANETIPSQGGFAIEKGIADQILDHAFGEGTVARLCNRIPVTQGNGLKIPCVNSSSRADGSRPLRGRWLEEAASITASTPTLAQMTFDLKTLAILCPVTNQLLEDAPSLEAWLAPAAAREISYCLDRAIIRGSGAGAPLGVLNAPCLVTQAAEGAQLADTILAENCIKMRARRLPGLKYTWLYSGNCFAELQGMTLAGTNAPAFVPIGGLNGLPYDTLMGDPIIESEHCSTLGDAGDLVYGAFSEYILAQRGDLRADTSIHVLFNTHETSFRFVIRIDGQPSLPSAIAPEQAPASTVSAFITLAARA